MDDWEKEMAEKDAEKKKKEEALAAVASEKEEARRALMKRCDLLSDNDR